MASAPTRESVLEALKSVYDPEIPINIVDLGLIYDVAIQEGRVRISMTLTAPHCPLAGFIQQNVRESVEKLDGVVSAEVDLVWDPPWSPERLSPELKAEFGM
jgi:FeS assembly SUF system protein